MSEKLMIEGTVTYDELEGHFLYKESPKGGPEIHYHGEELLSKFLGKRIRVTIEVLDADEDCPPPTDADGRRPMPEGGSKDW